MATYTITLKRLIDNGFQLDLNNYPIFEESYRETLNNKIINHYKFYEIGLETPQLFKDRLHCKLNEIMPYYNKLYESIPALFDPNTFSDTIKYLGETNNKTTNSGRDETTGENTHGQRTDINRNFDFDTPQNATSINLTNPDHMSAANTGELITGASTDTNSNTINYGRIVEAVESFVNRQNVHTGYNQSIYKTMLEFREAVLNIDMMIINDLRELFMLVY